MSGYISCCSPVIFFPVSLVCFSANLRFLTESYSGGWIFLDAEWKLTRGSIDTGTILLSNSSRATNAGQMLLVHVGLGEKYFLSAVFIWECAVFLMVALGSGGYLSQIVTGRCWQQLNSFVAQLDSAQDQDPLESSLGGFHLVESVLSLWGKRLLLIWGLCIYLAL